MATQELGTLLNAVYDPAAPPEVKREAEARLAALARTPEALQWAVGAIGNAAAGGDLPALFYACSVAAAAADRWAALDGGSQAALRATLWAAATQTGGPHFVCQKAAAAVAHIAALDWPERFPAFWPDLQAALSDRHRATAALDLLTATLEHFHSLAQATSAGLKGKVLSADVPGMQQRFRELQPVALATLCSLLHSLAAGLPAAVAGGDAASLALAAKGLRALRAALGDATRLPEQQGVSSAALTALLFEFVAAARLAPGGGDDGAAGAAAEAAAAALDCAADLQSKFLGQEATLSMLEVLLPKLQDTCESVQQRWAQAGGAFQADDPVLTSLVRLLVQLFTFQLSNVDATPQLGAALQGLLGRVLALGTVRRSPADLLLFLEVWHAVLTYLDGFESQLWDAEDDPAAAARVKQAAAGYRAPILAVAQLVLSTLCPAGSATSAPPPFGLDALSAVPGSGAAVEDWLQAVVAGGDAGREGEEAAAAAADDEEDEEGEVLVAGAATGGGPFQADSECEVYVRHAEGFLGRAIGSFSADLLPQVLLRFQAAGAAFVAASQQVTAAARQHPGGGGAALAAAAAAADVQLPASRALDVCLRLLTRCGPSFPTRGAAEAPPQLDGGGPVSGAHAVQSLRALFQLASAWLQAVQALGAAGQQGGAPATPARGGGDGGGLAALLLAGSQVYKAAGSLTATWLSQLVMGLVQGSADPDAAAAAQELVQGVLGAAAGLLQAAAAPQLAGWQAALHSGTVWAAEALLSLSSIALSNALKPPPALLGAVWGSAEVQSQLRPVAQAALGNPLLLPLRATRALWLSLSDLALRCWPVQPAARFDAAARAAAFGELVTPLVRLFQHAAAAGGDPAAAAAARQAAAAAAGIVQSYAGSPKAVRGIVSAALVALALPSVLAILRSSGGGGGGGGSVRGKAAAALLRLVSAALEVVATELGSEGVEQLLGALVQVFDTWGGDPSFEADLLLARLVVRLLSQGGSHRHAALTLPAAQYCLGVWERASAPGAAAAAEADVQHVRAEVLAALLSLLQYRWRTLMGSSKPTGGASGGTVQQQVASAAAAAAAGGGGGGGGAALVARVLQLLLEFFGAAASGAVVRPAADVRLVLEELFELQVATRLYSLPVFEGARAPLAGAILSMLLSRLYRGAQQELGDTLFALAAANWSEFHLQLLPAVLESRLGGVGGSERSALAALFGSADMEAHSFERALLAFLNDAAFYERAAGAA